MTTPGLVIVGSGPAGISAAETFRLYQDDLPITVLTADVHQPYARPPLSKDYLRGETDDVALHPEVWYSERSVQIRHVGAVEAIHTRERTVIADGTPIPYRALVLACGADPLALPVTGGELALQLRSLSNAAALRESANDAEAAVIIGAGFIGCEAAASLAMRGLSVTVVAPEAVPNAQRLGEQAGQRLRQLLENTGASYRGGVEVEALKRGAAHLDNGATLDADLILAATGVKPNSGLAEAAGLQIRQSRIVVDADMRTSAPDVYAAGDVALAHNATAGRHLAVEHWQDAIDQGAVAGANAAGESAHWCAVPGFWTTIGESTVKYHAWGDGYSHARMLERDDGFTVWYEDNGRTVGVLTCNADDDYDLAEELIEAGRPPPSVQT